MIALISTGAPRPDQLTDNKDKKYHADFARYILSAANSNAYRTRIARGHVNRMFYKGRKGQWILEEEGLPFLMDESGEPRNRIRFSFNKIRPMVESFRGNTIKLTLDGKAVNISPKAQDRRQLQLETLKFKTRVANMVGGKYKEAVQDENPIGDNEAATEELFDSTYSDELALSINELLKGIRARTPIEEMKVFSTESLIFDGVHVIKVYEANGHIQTVGVPPSRWFYDTNAIRQDLSDSEYMGEFSPLLPSEIYERFPKMTPEEREAVEKMSKGKSLNNPSTNYLGRSDGRIPVYDVYWRDVERQEYGWVVDENGYETYERINDKSSPYTDADLIEPSDEEELERMGGSLKERRYIDVLRFCTFIPNEVVGTRMRENNGIPDIILAHGKAPYQEEDINHESCVQFPYKCFCWSLQEGDILAPIDDAIDPQRFINRMISVGESQVNSSRGAGTVFDENSISRDGEADMLRDMNLSKPVKVRAKGGATQNAIGYYDSTVKQGTLALFNLANVGSDYISQSTGVNDQMTGTQGGAELVGVTKLMIAAGTLMQEPFFFALAQGFVQVFQAWASMGKKVYTKNAKKLSIMVGDKYAKTIELSKDVELEDFRVFVYRSTPDSLERETVDKMLLPLLQAGAIDDLRFAELIGKGSMQEMNAAIASFAKERVRAKLDQAREQQRMQPQIEQQMREQEEMAQAGQDRDRIAKQIADKELLDSKEKIAMIQSAGKNL